MEKKYELLKERYVEHEGRTLYRIRALIDFGNIKAGDIGGYIQKEENLSHKKNCWVYDDAKVFDNARILGNAKIFGNAQVYDVAQIHDDAHIYGDAKVYGEAIIYDYSLICGNAEIYENARIYYDAIIFDNANIYGNAKVYVYAQVYNYAKIRDNAVVHGRSKVYGYALLYGDAYIFYNNIISTISMPFKKIFQQQCRYRVLTAILTEDNKILYTIGCQFNITEEEFVDKIYNTNGGLEDNPHRQEYLEFIPLINTYLKGADKND